MDIKKIKAALQFIRAEIPREATPTVQFFPRLQFAKANMPGMSYILSFKFWDILEMGKYRIKMRAAAAAGQLPTSTFPTIAASVARLSGI